MKKKPIIVELVPRKRTPRQHEIAAIIARSTISSSGIDALLREQDRTIYELMRQLAKNDALGLKSERST